MMTDKPHLLKLNIVEWKALVLQRLARLGDGISQIGAHLEKQHAVTPQMLGELDEYFSKVHANMAEQWNDVRLPLKGWEQISRPFIAEYEAQQANQPQPQGPVVQPPPPSPSGQAVQADYIPAPKRKGGWPRGKKRTKPNVQSSAVILPPVTHN